MMTNSQSYTIDGRAVGKAEFDRFLDSLKEIDGTWSCAETNDGGITKYEARDSRGARYRYSLVQRGDRDEAMITTIAGTKR